ncbi:DUF1932 domain-containing protein [Leucobacter sp. G161]|uniref:DUF1932 domain-containing protein n=1 Tax=Leucobacter sp. G161 TaxID=663704 RepID=UPI00073B24C2|nr:DUF1932 domain-containing protein [Leucobacter sp. G161]KUF07846.1 hypothetical protein AUL38_00815 [Leucobacter sp. G161]
MKIVAVLGLGEAGALYARGFRDAGYEVAGYDPFTTLGDRDIRQEADLAATVGGAELVISLVGARAAAAVANDAFPLLDAGTVYADLNTGSPALKAQLEEGAASANVLFADVAVLAPVPRAGVRTPLMASGKGAERFRELVMSAGTPVDAIGGAAGDAAARKLLRSVFMKGLAAVVIESVGAAERAGADTWLREQIVLELSGDANVLIQRLIDGSRLHAERRAHEVEDAQAYLDELGQPTWMSAATIQWFAQLLHEADPAHSSEGAHA